MVALFALSALGSAFLLFWVEPLFARMILPLLGGSPAVWNTCLLSYQVLLLVGYLYAHIGARYLTVRRQALLHVVLVTSAIVLLPVTVPGGFSPPESGSVVAPLFLGTIIALGVPFVLLSATAPMLQRWIASTGHPSLENPYVLYAASNAGSFLGLLAFPVILEPNIGLLQQSRLWTICYVASVVLVGLCAVTVVRRIRPLAMSHPPNDMQDPSGAGEPGVAAERNDVDIVAVTTAERPPRLADRCRWLALAFIPSSMLLGVTTYLSTDVSAAPFLWVIPLSLYLMTFVVVFARRSPTVSQPVALLHAVGVATLVTIVFFWGADVELRWAYPLHLGVFTLAALVLHGELAVRRPAPAFLTEYYLWIALGGALGGAFTSLVAPAVFDSILEYPLMLVLACFLRPSWSQRSAVFVDRMQSIAIAVTPALLLAVVAVYGIGSRNVAGISFAWVASLVAIALVSAFWRTPARLGLSVAAIALAAPLVFQPWEDVIHAERSFFGMYRVKHSGNVTLFLHGTTIHGAQFSDAERRRRPLTYYHPNGPAGQVLQTLGRRGPGLEVGVVGLGAGSLLCYALPGQAWRFYEIDPAVAAIARDDRYFTFLRDCAVKASIVIGDARLTLAREADARFGLLVLDAFSSDAIPVHLLTREAFALYRRLLAPGGVILLHISNRHLDLQPVVAAVAADAGLAGRISEHSASDEAEATELEYECDWVVLARNHDDLAPFLEDSRWQPLNGEPSLKPWTDDYSNVFRAIRW